MTAVIIPETLHVDDLPGIWSPVQWLLSEDEARRRAGAAGDCQPALRCGCA